MGKGGYRMLEGGLSEVGLDEGPVGMWLSEADSSGLISKSKMGFLG